MKKTKDVEIEKYRVTDDTYILLEHNADSDAYFATVVSPENDFAVPLYSFNNTSLFYLRYNPKGRFKSFEDAINYIDRSEDVQYELKSFIPGCESLKEDDSFESYDLNGNFPLGDMIEFKAKLLTAQWTKAEMNQMLLAAKEKTLAITDDVVVDQFIQSKKKIDHSSKTEYYRLMFLYTTFNNNFDEAAEGDIDNILSIIFSKKIVIQNRKDKDIIYKRIAEVLTVYDDVFSEGTNSPKMTFWLKKSIANVLKLYHLI